MEKRSTAGWLALDRESMKLAQSNDKLKQQLAEANAKLESIENALPGYGILGSWGTGAKAIEKLNPDQVEQAIKKMPKVDQAVVKLLQDHHKLEKQLASANAKLKAVKDALPLIPQSWGSGPRAFVDKVRSIIEAP